jgi:hypothetical protein
VKIQILSPRRRAPAVLALAAVLAACAPDAITNREATGFNAYINQIATACKPLMVGEYNMTYQLENNGLGDNQVNYFFDVTSQLYYQRSTPADYRTAVNGFFGGGSRTNRSIDCIIANLPADRPKGGPPIGGLINVN